MVKDGDETADSIGACCSISGLGSSPCRDRHSLLGCMLTASIQISPVKQVATVVKTVHVVITPRFVAPAGVITAIPKVGIPGVTVWDRGNPAVGKDLSKGIFAECA